MIDDAQEDGDSSCSSMTLRQATRDGSNTSGLRSSRTSVDERNRAMLRDTDNSSSSDSCSDPTEKDDYTYFFNQQRQQEGQVGILDVPGSKQSLAEDSPNHEAFDLKFSLLMSQQAENSSIREKGTDGSGSEESIMSLGMLDRETSSGPTSVSELTTLDKPAQQPTTRQKKKESQQIGKAFIAKIR